MHKMLIKLFYLKKNAYENVWGNMKLTERGKHLVRLAEIIEREAPRLRKLEVKDNGQLLAEMRSQTRYTAEWYRYYGGLADEIERSVIPINKGDIFNFTTYEPYGVVGLITPLNSPLLLVTCKLVPALPAGNIVVIKPSEFTSVSTLEFIELIKEADFSDGVVKEEKMLKKP